MLRIHYVHQSAMFDRICRGGRVVLPTTRLETMEEMGMMGMMPFHCRIAVFPYLGGGGRWGPLAIIHVAYRPI